MKWSAVVLCLSLLVTPVVAGDQADAPLADAAEQNDTRAACEFLKQGADINAAQVDGMTALHWAAYHDDLDLATQLVRAGADVEAVNRYGVSALSIACLNGNSEIVELLLNAGADPHTTLPGGETALMTAARTGRVGPVQALLLRGADPNAKEHNGQTAIMWAAAEGNLEAVDALLAAGADFQTPLESGFTPLFFAVREGRTAVALHLLNAGLDVNDVMQRARTTTGLNALTLAVENAHYETAMALLDAGADPNAQPKGYAPLHAITWVRKPQRGDGDPSPVGSGGVSPLEFVRAIVAHGADVNIRLADGRSGFADFTMTGSTPLVLAAQTGDLPLMKLLLELGADPTIPNADNSTPLIAAAGIGDLGSGQQSAGTEEEAIAAVKLLLELGLEINAVDDNGETAMHGAAYQNWPKLVEFLAENGAEVSGWNHKNRWGWTPLLIAQGYREGNFRPDVATIDAISRVMLAAGVTPPAPDSDVVANQQSWDKKKPTPMPPEKTKPEEDQPTKSEKQPGVPSQTDDSRK